eukprot:scaffold694_cov338-Pavlova_lutheri.AAC.32
MGRRDPLRIPPFDAFRPRLSTKAHGMETHGHAAKCAMQKERKNAVERVWKWAAALVAIGIGSWVRRKNADGKGWTKKKRETKRRCSGIEDDSVDTPSLSTGLDFGKKTNKDGGVDSLSDRPRPPLMENARSPEPVHGHAWVEADSHGKENREQFKVPDPCSNDEDQDTLCGVELGEENSHLKNTVIKLTAKIEAMQQQLHQEEQERKKMRAALEAKESMFKNASQKVDQLERELKYVGRDGEEVERVESELHAARKEMEAMKRAHADEAAKWLSEADALQQAVQAAQLALLKIMGQDSGSGTATASDSEATTSRASRHVRGGQVGSQGTGHVSNGVEDVDRGYASAVPGQS